MLFSSSVCSSDGQELSLVTPGQAPPIIRPAKATNGFNDGRCIRSFNSIIRQAKNPNFTGMHQQARLGFRRKKSNNGVRLRPLEGDILMPTPKRGFEPSSNADLKPQALMPSLPKLPSPASASIRDPYDDMPVRAIHPVTAANVSISDLYADMPVSAIHPVNSSNVGQYAHLPVGVIVPTTAQSLPSAKIPAGQGVVLVQDLGATQSKEEPRHVEQHAEAQAKARAAGIEARARAEAAMAASKKLDEQAAAPAKSSASVMEVELLNDLLAPSLNASSQPAVPAQTSASAAGADLKCTGAALNNLRARLATGLMCAATRGDLGAALGSNKKRSALPSQSRDLEAETSKQKDSTDDASLSEDPIISFLGQILHSGAMRPSALMDCAERGVPVEGKYFKDSDVRAAIQRTGSFWLERRSQAANWELGERVSQDVQRLSGVEDDDEIKFREHISSDVDPPSTNSAQVLAIKQGVAQKLLSHARSRKLSQTLFAVTMKPQGTCCPNQELIKTCKAKAIQSLIGAAKDGTLATTFKKVVQGGEVCKKKEKVCQSPTPGPNETFEFRRPSVPSTPKSSCGSRPESRHRSFKRPPAAPSPALD